MISVEAARDKILGYVDILDSIESPILDCAGQVLAEDVYSDINVPPLDNSAMDGYAVMAADTSGASSDTPRVLRVTGTVAAGAIAAEAVTPGSAMRIMTGAPLPAGADSVVPFEDTDEQQRGDIKEIGILCQVATGKNVRRAGEDITRSSLVLRRGTVLRPSEIGILASLGRSRVKVVRRPKVAILATGDELVDIGEPLPSGKIYNSNAYSVAALVARYGGIPVLLGIALDNEESLVARLRRATDCDLLITTGGVSKGDYDMVKDVLAKEGEVVFWQVRMKPGKPLAFGRVNGIPLLGLPGNPVSSMITFELFARSAILKMMGKTNLDKPSVEAIMEGPVVNTDGRQVYARAVVEKRDGQYYARLTGPQGSGILTSMSLANGLVIVPEDRASIEEGESARVLMLDWDETV